LGVNINGNPGLPGWVAVALELVVGGALVAASLIARPAEASLPVTSPPANPPTSTSTT